MKNVFLYSHGGSGNHGCEAIVRTTINVIGDNVVSLFSASKDEDLKYGISNIKIFDSHNPKKSIFELLVASLSIRIFKNDRYAELLDIKHMFNAGDIALSIGGDNYCYKGFEQYCFKNQALNDNGVKTALWGCSIEPDMINDVMKEDLSKYSLITVRESITYEAIKNFNKNTFLYPDPAFTLGKIEKELPGILKGKRFVGINLSPMIIDAAEKNPIVYQNYRLMIKYIIENTSYNIALIPHVVWSSNDDRKAMQPLLDEFKETNRVVIIEDCNCLELKGYISRCDMFIGARTHATIAAYSTCVPTLVVGYSVKAKGIATDLFGTYENYVIPVQSLTNDDDLKKGFIWLNENKESIKAHLNEIMPKYIHKAYEAGEKFREVFGIKKDD